MSRSDWVADLWLEVRPSAAAKVATIAGARDALAAGALAEEVRAAALQEAHRLTGSLGAYGIHAGSQAAAEAERILEAPTPGDAPALARAVAVLEEVTAPPT